MASLPGNQQDGQQWLRLGTFEVDLKAGELRRNGTRIRLQEQPLQILGLLLDRPGEVVSREELRNRLWPADTYVDFDHSLNAAVRRLRDALGDSAENPRFVETVARRGYRLLAPVLALAPPQAPASGNVAVLPMPKKAGVPWRWAIASALAIFLVGAGAFVGWRLGRESSPPSLLSQRRLTANPSNAPILTAAISPDGEYLAYADKTGAYLRQVRSGETHPIAAADGLQIYPVGWFPDNSHLIALRSTGPNQAPDIWSISILGGAARKLVDNGHEPAVSADGTQIAFLRGSNGAEELWLVQSDGSNPRRLLATNGMFLGSPTWAPDAGHLALLSGSYHAGSFNLDTRIEIVDPKTGHHEKLLALPRLNGGMAWTRAGRLLFSVREAPPNDDDSNLWFVKVDQKSATLMGAPTRITRDTGAAHSVTATANGTRLAFFRSTWQPDVYTTEVSGTRLSPPKLLTLDERTDFPYAWTPDSRSVIFASNRDGDMHIFRQRIDQSAPELLVGGNQPLQIPRLNPDRSTILYLVTPRLGDASNRVRLMRVSIDGGPPQKVLEADSINNHQCAVLPATLCVFSTFVEHQIRFFKFDPVTGAVEEIQQWRFENADYNKVNWSLSPDGQTLAISGLQAGAITLKSLSRGSSRSIPIPSWPGIGSLDWAADGRSLWVTATAYSTRSALLNLDLRGNVRTMLQDDEMRIGWAIQSPDGRRLALWKASGDSNVWMLDNFDRR